MANKHDTQIKKLDQKIRDLKKLHDRLGNGTELDFLLQVIHKPPWTTQREVAFSLALVDSMTSHTKALIETRAALLKGAKTPSIGE